MTDVLLVAYHYPPISSAGTQRAVALAERLPDHGFRPQVLTTDAFGTSAPDAAYRASEWVGWYRRLFNRAVADLPDTMRSRTRTGDGSSLASRLARACLIPDAQIGWLPTAWRASRRIIDSHPVRAILTTGPPFSSHLLGLALHHATCLPWVADFRDTWTYDPLNDAVNSGRIRPKIERAMERAVLDRATEVTCVTEVAADANRRRGAQRVTVIENGYDDRAITPGEGKRDGARFRFVHVGSFSMSHPARSPKPLVEAAMQVAGDFEVVFVGALTGEERATVQPLVDAGKGVVVGPVDRDRAMAWQGRADALVVVDHPRDVLASNVPGKVYEYGASGRPILAIVPRGATRDLVTWMGAGVCVGHDSGEIAAAMGRFLAGEIAAGDAGKWARYERGEMVRRMGEVLGRVVG